MKQLTPEQFKEYAANPLATDEKLRKWVSVPDDRYYSVSMWPDELAGRVWVNMKDYRKVPAKKISKSDQ